MQRDAIDVDQFWISSCGSRCRCREGVMAHYILRRLLVSLPALLGVLLAGFLLM